MREASARRSDALDAYRRANAAYHAEDYDEAIRLFRDAVAAGAPAKASRKLGGLLHHRGKTLVRNGEPESALRDLREAHALVPDDEKLTRRLGALLRDEYLAACQEGEHASIDAVVRELAAVAPESSRISRLSEAAEEISDLMERRWQGSEGPTLVIVEQGVDPVDLATCLRALPGPSHILTQRRWRSLREAPGRKVAALQDQGRVGLEEDMQLGHRTDAIAESVRRAIAAHVPHSDRVAHGVDVLEHMSFELDDAVWYAGRQLVHASQALREDRHDRVLLISAGDGLAQCLAPLALDAFQDRALVLDVTGELGARPAPLDSYRWEPSPTPIAPPVPGVSTGLRAGTSASPTKPMTWRPDGPALVMPSPGRIHVRNLAAVLEEMSDSRSAVVLAHATKGAHREAYAPLFDLARARGDVILDPVSTEDAGMDEEGRSTLERVVNDVLGSLNSETRLEGMDTRPLLRSRLITLLGRRLPAYRRVVEVLDGVVARHRPSVLLVSPDRTTMSRIAISVCRARGIPSVFPQTVYFSESPRYKPIQADWLTVADDWSRDLAVRRFGHAPERTRVVGFPQWELAAKQHSDPKPGHVTLILQRASLESNLQLIRPLASAIAEIPQSSLTVRMHPGEAESHRRAYERELSGWGPDAQRMEVDRTGELVDALGLAEVVVSLFSNVIVEAAIMHRPVICANFDRVDLPIPFPALGLATEVNSAPQLREELGCLLEDPLHRASALDRQQAYFDRNPHLRAGGAARRTADLLEHVAARPTRAVQ